jgi:hypothetical protein
MNLTYIINETDYSKKMSRLMDITNINEPTKETCDNKKCLFTSKYAINNIINSNNTYKNNLNDKLNKCNICSDKDYKDKNNFFCHNCLNNYYYSSKVDKQYIELLNKYLETLSKNVCSDKEKCVNIKNDISIIKFAMFNTSKDALNKTIKYYNLKCNTDNILECNDLQLKIENLNNSTNQLLLNYLISKFDYQINNIKKLKLNEKELIKNYNIIKSINKINIEDLKKLEKDNDFIYNKLINKNIEHFTNDNSNNNLYYIIFFIIIFYIFFR